MGGVEATEKIRRFEETRKITPISPPDTIIIALTASTLSADHDRAMKAGCNDFLLKPISLRWLEKKVREWGNIQAVIDYKEIEQKMKQL